MSKASATSHENTSQMISSLVEISKLDTLYRDLFFQRALELMGTLLSQAAYTNAKENAALLGFREQQLRSAVERGNWKRTGELTERVRRTRESVAAASQSMGLAETVYDRLADIPIDPFSPGFHVFLQGSTETLQEWRSRAIAILSALERMDSLKRDFYARRRTDFQALKVGTQIEQRKTTASVAANLQQEALSALDSGDLSQLDRLVEKLMQKSEAREAKQDSAEVERTEAAELGEDLLCTFSETTLAAASQLGLAPARTHSRRQFASLLPYGWQPSFLQTESKRRAQDQLTNLMNPTDTASNVRDAIELFLLNPFINSGGTRYHVCLVAEDLLLEDFPEPEPKAEMARTGLLSALGLSQLGVTEYERDFDRRRVGVVCRLRHVQIIVRLDVLVLALLVTHQLKGDIGEYLIGVHVCGGTCATLIPIDLELIVILAVEHRLTGLFNRRQLLFFHRANIRVGTRSGKLGDRPGFYKSRIVIDKNA